MSDACARCAACLRTYVLYDPNTRNATVGVHVIRSETFSTVPHNTTLQCDSSNQATYHALLFAAQVVKQMNWRCATIYCSSDLHVRQILNECKTKEPALAQLCIQMRESMGHTISVVREAPAKAPTAALSHKCTHTQAHGVGLVATPLKSDDSSLQCKQEPGHTTYATECENGPDRQPSDAHVAKRVKEEHNKDGTSLPVSHTASPPPHTHTRYPSADLAVGFLKFIKETSQSNTTMYWKTNTTACGKILNDGDMIYGATLAGTTVAYHLPKITDLESAFQDTELTKCSRIIGTSDHGAEHDMIDLLFARK